MNVEQATVEQLLQRSNDIRRGAHEEPATAFGIAKRLADEQYLEHARRLAQHIADGESFEGIDAVELYQQWALWTSKNPDAPDDSKHGDALAILDDIKHLENGQSLDATTDPETLGIAGGICKRQWMIDGLVGTLDRSLRFYERGAAQGIESDNGYNAINAAFVLDLQAYLSEDDRGQARRERARRLREEVRDGLLTLKDRPTAEGKPPRGEMRWFQETLAEAYFGLGPYDEANYEHAAEQLKLAYHQDVKPWEYETTARQFAWLARIQDPQARTSQDFERSPVWSVLRRVYGDSTTAGAGSLFAGKLGLALSGGGFRASLFHIGVLAGLAERDMLRHVEVLSCVSGGSILGAHYYLEVRKLLKEKADEDITREDYILLVERLARDFLAGVQRNIRTRVTGSLWANLRMMFQPGYTRTNRLGELYEKHLYARIHDDGERVLRKLIIEPHGEQGFKPKYANWKRSNKVPILILNSTSVNTGHNWQFTATWMGEPPASIDSQIDANYRLRRLYYTDAPGKHKDIRIGQAAAASSCVPGLFTPLELRDLYEGVTVRLVDGGVHDNQGVFSLLDQNCSVMVVSDATGQMSAKDQPKDGVLEVLLRTTSILQARVRMAQYREIRSRTESGRLKGLLFLHLKKDLEVEDRDWVTCDNPKQLSADALRKARSDLTTYRITKALQRRIADIRTDLDSFSEAEAYALMVSGCNMVRAGFKEAIDGFAIAEREHEWSFLKLSPELSSARPAEVKWLDRLLDAASMTFFKVWRLAPSLRVTSWVLGAAAAVGLLWILVNWRAEPFLTPKGLAAAAALAVLGAAAAALGLQALVRLIRYRKTVHQILWGAGLSLAGTLVSWVHLTFFDPWFLKRGKVPALGESQAKRDVEIGPGGAGP